MRAHRCVVFALALCLLVCRAASAQYRYDTWTTDNGLPQNGVRAITQTPDGYLWFTTFDGLVRFDGVNFTTFGTGNTRGIINNRFTGLYSDKNGTLYATTMEDGVLTVYRDGVFSSYTSAQVPGHYIQKIEPDARGELRFLVEDDGRTTKSWYHLRDGKFVLSETIIPNVEEITLTGPDGASWTVSPRRAVERRGGKSTVYPLDIKSPGFTMNTFADRAGNLWIGEYAVHRVGGGTVRHFGEADGLPRSIHHSFWEEPDGSIWFAAGGGSTQGVGLVRHLNGTLRTWGTESGLLSPSIYSVFHDREGTTWLATNKGLSRLRKNVLQSFSVKDGLTHSEVYPIYRDRQERIWIGTTQGLSIHHNGAFTTVNLKPADANAPAVETWRGPEMSVQSLWEDAKGRMWIGLDGGIFIADRGSARFLAGTRGLHVFAIAGDRNGTVWAATNRGLLRIRDDRLEGILSVKDGLPNEFMTVVFEDSKGRLWFGGLGGLSLYEGGKLTNYTAKQGLTGNYVRSVYEDADGTLWIGTYGEGMSRFRDGRFVNYRAQNGLYSDGVFAIEEDARGNFWISSNRGIYRVKRRELNDLADGKIDRISSVGYGVGDGMLSSECNGGRQPASLTDKDGRFWFPTQNGVVVIEPGNERANDHAPSVVIESATIERESADVRRALVVPPGRENVEINYTGISLIKSDQIRFRYKLEGHDPDWIDAGTRRTAYYSYLPPGRYRFVVTAGNSDDVWNEQGASLGVEFQPFFYQTRLFYLTGGIAVAALLLGAWLGRANQFRSRERELAALVEHKTEELRKANAELQQLAHTDGLTGVANRRAFEEFLADEWRRALRSREPVSLLILDIDHFKLFNDTYGHHAGDECLKSVAAALKATIRRPTDLVARFGGEEFAIVLGGTDLPGALIVARQAMETVFGLKIPHAASQTSEYLTVSIGVAATTVTSGMSESDLIVAADAALYRAKADGRALIRS
jgi:diguanylate cyclase (GGDEF)-like protein